MLARGRGGYYQWVEAGVRPLLGILERLALLDLLAARHGDLPRAVHPVPAHSSRQGCRSSRPAGGPRPDLGCDLAQPPRHAGGRTGVGLVFVATVLLPFGVLVGLAIVRWMGESATSFQVTPFHAAGSSFLGALGPGGPHRASGTTRAGTMPRRSAERSSTRPRRTAGAGAHAAARDGSVPALRHARARAHAVDGLDRRCVAGSRRSRRWARGSAAGLAVAGMVSAFCALQRAAARVLAHSAGAGAGRSAAASTRGHRRARHAA